MIGRNIAVTLQISLSHQTMWDFDEIWTIEKLIQRPFQQAQIWPIPSY